MTAEARELIHALERERVRVLAATNQPLQKLVDEGKFRADLFYRLNFFPLSLPPLREQRKSLPPDIHDARIGNGPIFGDERHIL